VGALKNHPDWVVFSFKTIQGMIFNSLWKPKVLPACHLLDFIGINVPCRREPLFPAPNAGWCGEAVSRLTGKLTFWRLLQAEKHRLRNDIVMPIMSIM
jgi:hypothetical protein